MSDTQSPELKKARKIGRACDRCRNQKIKCDGFTTVGSTCNHCKTSQSECTYLKVPARRGPVPRKASVVDALLESGGNINALLDKVEAILTKMYPHANFQAELSGILFKAQNPPNSLSTSDFTAPSGVAKTCFSGGSKSYSSPGRSSSKYSTLPRESSGTCTTSEEETSMALIEDLPQSYPLVCLSDQLGAININKKFYMGKSSNISLLKTALSVKSEAIGVPDTSNRHVMRNRREEFWNPRPWEAPFIGQIDQAAWNYEFPEADLARSLVDLYFLYSNPFYPVLHRPTFEKALSDGLHLLNEEFAIVVLAVLSVGSRHSDDPRVFLHDYQHPMSAGWPWFKQILKIVHRTILPLPALYSVQYYCLASLFMSCSCSAAAAWRMIGIGIRLAQDAGAHRRRHTSMEDFTAQDELMKRAFWTLLVLERSSASIMGRPPAIADDDFDLELPLDVDDIYWENLGEPEKAFIQPAGVPSTISYFISTIRLSQVLANTLRTLYSLNKTDHLVGGHEREQVVVRKLDSALNSWIDSVPEHIRWDPHRRHPLFYEQSVSLYTAYYGTQILVHRPFIVSTRRNSPQAFPSLSICTTAARACSNLFVERPRELQHGPTPHLFFRAGDAMSVMNSATVLVLNIWGNRRSVGLRLDPTKELEAVHRCLRFFQEKEGRLYAAGKSTDTILELISHDNPAVSPPLSSTATSTTARKRNREVDEDEPSPSTNSSSGTVLTPDMNWLHPSVWTPPVAVATHAKRADDISPDVLGKVFLEELGGGGGPQYLPEQYYPGIDEGYTGNSEMDPMAALWAQMPIAYESTAWDDYISGLSRSGGGAF